MDDARPLRFQPVPWTVWIPGFQVSMHYYCVPYCIGSIVNVQYMVETSRTPTLSTVCIIWYGYWILPQAARELSYRQTTPRKG